LGIKLVCPKCKNDDVYLIKGELGAYSVMYRLIPFNMQRIETFQRRPIFDPQPPKSEFQCRVCNISWKYNKVRNLIEDAVRSYLVGEVEKE